MDSWRAKPPKINKGARMLELICYIAAVAILIAFTLVVVSVCGFFLLIMSKNTLEIYGEIKEAFRGRK